MPSCKTNPGLPTAIGVGESSTTETGNNSAKDNNNSTKDDANKHKQFEGEGVVFKAKLVGTELVIEPRGDKMCQNSIQRLKAIIKGQKSHKRRVVMKISYAGVKIYDEKTNEILHFHEVPQISFIASDDTDARTFGYVCDVPSKAHQFICFKTSGPAAQVMSVISQLFEAVLEQKKGSASRKNSESAPNNSTPNNSALNNCGPINSGLTNSGPIDTASAISKLILLESSPQPPEETSEKKTADSLDTGKNNKPRMTKVSSFIDDFDVEFDWAKPEPSQPITVQKPNRPVLLSSTHQQLSASMNDSTMSRLDFMGGSCGGSGGDSGIIDSPSSSAFSEWCNQSPSVLATSPATQVAPTASRTQLDLFNQKYKLPTALPRQSSLQQSQSSLVNGSNQQPQQQNRSLVHNHSSVSLNDAVLTRQSSYINNYHNDSSDKYAVFNDIDNLPSIFESSPSLSNSLHQRLGSSVASTQSVGSAGGLSRQTNPFDDDFFA